jgi:hypothetical protein
VLKLSWIHCVFGLIFLDMPVNQDGEDAVPIGQQTLLDLVGNLKALTTALVEAKAESAAAKAESSVAIAASTEAKAQNTALQIQIQSQKDKRLGGYKFRHVGNEINFSSNIDCIALATQALTSYQTGRFDQLEKWIKDIIAQLMRQNKHIKWADSSPGWWGLIVEFLGIEVAEDDAEERKYNKAEKSLEAKYKRKLEADARAHGNKKGPRNTSDESAGYSNDHTYTSENRQHSSPAAKSKSSIDPRTLIGPCYRCKGPHIRKYCPKLAEETADIQAKIEEVIAEAQAR